MFKSFLRYTVAEVKEAVRLYFLPVTAIWRAYREEFKRN